MKYVFAGAETKNYAEALKAMNVQNVLQSYYHLGFTRTPNEFSFPFYLLDSGGFTIRTRGAEVSVYDYVEYINRHDVQIAFNLDTNSMSESIENQKILQSDTKAKIIPVYHYSDWLDTEWKDVLARWVDEGHDYIAVAGATAPRGSRSRFYEHCFSVVKDRVRIHGLAATAIDDMLSFPFYSVDSTTWLNAEKFGEYHEFKDGRILKLKSLRVESKSKNPKLRDARLLTAEKGFFLRSSVDAYLKFEKFVTALWAQKGIVWVDGN